MSEPIKAGDLVMVVRWEHKHGKGHLGMVFTVSGFNNHGSHCIRCNNETYTGRVAEATIGKTLCGLPIPWLKRIPPIGELDDVKRDEEITA